MKNEPAENKFFFKKKPWKKKRTKISLQNGNTHKHKRTTK